MERRRQPRATLKTREVITVEQRLREHNQPRKGTRWTPSSSGGDVIKLASKPSTSHVRRDLFGGRLTTEDYQ